MIIAVETLINWMIKEVLKECSIIMRFLISTIGPIKRKAKIGAVPKVDSRDAPIKASASLQRDKMKASSIMTKIAVKALPPICVNRRVGK